MEWLEEGWLGLTGGLRIGCHGDEIVVVIGLDLSLASRNRWQGWLLGWDGYAYMIYMVD